MSRNFQEMPRYLSEIPKIRQKILERAFFFPIAFQNANGLNFRFMFEIPKKRQETPNIFFQIHSGAQIN